MSTGPSSSNQAQPSPFEALLGTTLDGRYRLDRILGQGGMGVVFQATQTSMNRPIALKMLNPSLGGGAASQFAERFRREAEVVSRLKHPQIIAIIDFGQSRDGALFYAMELLEGENLKSMVKRDGPMTVGRAVNVIRQVGEALAYAHAEGILHRDMKPHNVMCQRLQGRDHVKVLDFGLVKMVGEDDPAEENLTTAGQVLGTPAYMSPEQAAGDPVDARSDLYSLAVTLYFLLAGSTPFKAASPQKLLAMAIANPIPPIAERRKGAPVPAQVEAFLTRALAYHRDERPADAEQWLAELEACLSGLSAEELEAVPTGAIAPPGDAKSSITSQPRRSTSQSGVRAQRSQVGSGSGSGSSVSRVAANRTPVPPPAKTPWPWIGAGGGLLVALLAAVFLWPSAPPPPRPMDPEPKPTTARPADPTHPPRPATVTLKVTSEPAGAELFDGDKRIGVTPGELVLPRDRAALNLTFKLAGHQAVTRGIDLGSAPEAAPLEVSVVLAPEAVAPVPTPVDPPKVEGSTSSGRVEPVRKPGGTKRPKEEPAVPVFD